MKTISKRKVEMVSHYHRVFEWKGRDGAGFSFDCDAVGTVAPEKQAQVAECLANPLLRDCGISRYERKRITPSIGECECGGKVALRNATNTCACGLDYNTFGQKLAPRDQWGEETGERPEECV